MSDKEKVIQTKVATRERFNPFPGLRPFNMDESHLFFGRQGQSDEVLHLLSRNRFVAVIGGSGSGKSSLMYCGLAPILYGGFITDAGSSWRIVATRPGNGPINNLAKSLAKSEGDFLREDEKHFQEAITASVLRSSSLGLIEAVNQLNRSESENILILVDQFEELFRYKRSAADSNALNESVAFVKLLLEAVHQRELPIYIVLTMRSDFIGDCAQYQELTDMINDSHYLIPQMTRNDLRDAIVGPVAVGGGAISERLVDQLLNETGDNPDLLPILQHALMRTWDYWESHVDTDERMDITHYDAIGRLEKALSEHANEAFEELTPRGKEICEKLFKALTESIGEGRGIRHPSSIAEVCDISLATTEEVIEVVEPFRKAGRTFLTPSYQVELGAKSMVDISHESLMRVWDKLMIWVQEEAASVQMYSRLSEAAALYQAGETGLWRPPDLQLALNWRMKQQPTLTWAKRYAPAFERTMAYVNASEEAYIAEEQNKIKLQKRALRRSRITALVLGIAAICSMGMMVYAYTLKIAAESAEAEAVKNEQLAKQQEAIADENARLAQIEKERADVEKKEAEKQKEAAVAAQAKAEEERIKAVASEREANNQRAKALKNFAEAQEQRAIAEEKTLVAVEQTEKAELAKANALTLRMLSIAQSMSVKSVGMSRQPERQALVAYQAYLFNEQNNGEPHSVDIYAGLYSSLKTLNKESYNNLIGHTAAVRSLQFTPSGTGLYSTGSDGSILKWNLSNPENPIVIGQNQSINSSLALSSTGRYLACGTDDAIIQIYDTDKLDRYPKVLKGHKDVVWATHFVGGEERLVSSSADSTILLWNLSTKEFVVLARTKSRVRSIAVSPNGALVAGGLEDGKIVVWDLTRDNRSEILFEEKGNSVLSLHFSNDGKLLASGDLNGFLKVWDMQSLKIVRALEGQHARIVDVKFSPDKTLVASASFDGTVHVYATKNYDIQPIVLQDHDTWVKTIAFSPDSETLITGCVDNQIKRYPTKTLKMAEQICGKIERNMTEEEWRRYVAPDIPRKKTCPDLKNEKEPEVYPEEENGIEKD